jgi:diguanylate cyclase (GGDEF)-like protein
MSVVARFDIRTVLACMLMLAFVFSAVFLAMKLAYRNLHGVGSLSLGFFFGTIGITLLASRGYIPHFVSFAGGHSLIMLAALLLYRCVLLFPQRKMVVQNINLKFRWAAALVAFAIPVLIWSTAVNQSVIPRLAMVVTTSAIICALIAYELLHAAGGRIAMQLFALFMAVRSAGFLYRVAHALIRGSLPDFLTVDSVPAFVMAMGLLSVSLLGIFFLIMIGDELTLAVEHRASLDPLTGTLNRHGIEVILATELNRARRNDHPLSVILIDIDRFKGINDSGGHAVGDAALRIVAQGILHSLRSYDLLGRYGGDEFLLLLPETSILHALEVAHRIQSLLALPSPALQFVVRPTVSMGVAQMMLSDSPKTLIARADAALYDAKHAGRNCVRHRDSCGVHPVQVPVPEVVLPISLLPPLPKLALAAFAPASLAAATPLPLPVDLLAEAAFDPASKQA